MRRIVRLPAIVLLVAGGIIHLQLWRGGYRAIPYIGPWFILNVVVSALLGGALLLRHDVRVTVAAIGFSLASLAALVMSRTTGLFGFMESNWTEQAVRATTAEAGATVALALIVVAARMRGIGGRRVPIPVRVDEGRRPRR